ncbi:ShlB/FhaC/HecB family hemolysin secretion/activation protein [uncultured Phenylobacterium sp.]|uniref:ShlB/FhaC/HecB family hemolysin secretion/activation protein n=1 Tax=uncultured Phenylobacterium sp. TaxID=349273 RepID=UPI0025F606EC|nr:ShlB/FhaC/HecB family hemolysin secretion/activation protein [uncultured Phenylobacterium sp.]
MRLPAARFGAAGVLAIIAAPGIAHAQVSVAPTRQELNPAARAQQAPPAPDLFSHPGAGPCPLAVDPAPLTIASVTLRGLESVPAAELQGAYADLLNRQGDAADLCKVRDRLAEALFDRGLLARVEIPAQTIDAGAVTLEVIEAHIVNVTVRGDPGPAGPALERYASKLRGMAPFDVNRVQRYVLLASDVPGLRVRASVRPNASGARGAVDLDLNVERNAEDLIVNAQNLQAKTTGRWGVLARYDVNAHTAWGQQTSFAVYRTIRNEQWVVQGLEEARLGGEGWVVRASAAYGESRPGDVLKGLGLKSTSLVANLEAAYPLVRKRRENLSVAAGLEVVDQDTRLSGGGRLINDDLRILYARAEANRTFYWWGYRPMVVSGDVGVRRGLEGLGATDAGDRLLSRAEARTSAWVASARADVLALLGPRLQARVAIDAQYSRKPLAAYEEYAVGSLTIGRGYDPAYISGDSAIAASFELRGGPFQPRSGFVFSPYAFFDIAHTSDRDTGARDETVSSVGGGVQLPILERWVLDVGYAHPLEKRAFERKRPPGRLLVNFTARFF